jgi:hypothetical protein
MYQRMSYERGAKEVAPSRIRRWFGRLRPGASPGLAWLYAGAGTPRSPSSFRAGPVKDLA